jgi:hypothetical protein
MESPNNSRPVTRVNGIQLISGVYQVRTVWRVEKKRAQGCRESRERFLGMCARGRERCWLGDAVMNAPSSASEVPSLSLRSHRTPSFSFSIGTYF